MIKPLLRAIALFLAITALYTKQSHAQTAAYIIEGSDTTHGVIQYKNWSRSPDEIKFKPKSSADFVIIHPADISEFGVYLDKQVEKYRSFTVAVDESPTSLSSLSEKFDPKMSAPKQIFALLLIDGTAQLYNYTDLIKDHYLFRKRNGNIFELISKEYLSAADSKVLKNDAFKKQLLDQTSDCETIKLSSISKLTYYESSLSKFVAKYNECLGDKTEPVFTKGEVKLLFTALGGISFTQFKLSPGRPEFRPNYGISFTSKATPSFGMSFGVIPSRSRFNYFAELLYRQYAAEGNYSTASTNQSETGQYTFEAKNIDLNLGIKYMFTTGQLKSFAIGGLANGFIISQKNALNRNVSFYNSNSVVTTTTGNRPTYELGGYLGLGMQYGKVGLQARYQTFKSFDTFTVFNGQTKHINLLITYSF